MENKLTVPDLKELFKQAAEIAKQVPENMQEAAFLKAVDLLSGETKESTPLLKSNSTASNSNPNNEAHSNEEDIHSFIDTTKHPGVAAAAKVLDRSLMILQIAKTEHGVDGLTPNEIATVLTEKFRLRTTKEAVSMALGKVTDLVNRTRQGTGYKYQIMGPGEDYLIHLGEEDNADTAKPKRKKKVARSKAKSEVAKKSKKTSKRPGPKKILEGLIDEGFFTEPKEISAIIKHIQRTNALTFKATDMSPTLVRLLREDRLERTKNDENRYQYVHKS